jgi:hypothetical protein
MYTLMAFLKMLQVLQFQLSWSRYKLFSSLTDYALEENNQEIY